MTTVLAVERGGDVLFASDSQATWGNLKAEGEQKVFRVGPVVYGSAGDVRVGNVIRHTPLPDYTGRSVLDAEAYLVNELIPVLLERLEKDKTLKIEDAVAGSESHLIVAVGGRAFYLASNFALVRTSDGVYGVGSGSHFGLGALHAGSDLRGALKIATKLDTYTGGQIRLHSANDMIGGKK